MHLIPLGRGVPTGLDPASVHAPRSAYRRIPRLVGCQAAGLAQGRGGVLCAARPLLKRRRRPHWHRYAVPRSRPGSRALYVASLSPGGDPAARRLVVASSATTRAGVPCQGDPWRDRTDAFTYRKATGAPLLERRSPNISFCEPSPRPCSTAMCRPICAQGNGRCERALRDHGTRWRSLKQNRIGCAPVVDRPSRYAVRADPLQSSGGSIPNLTASRPVSSPSSTGSRR
jgi:hypothetical protein